MSTRVAFVKRNSRSARLQAAAIRVSLGSLTSGQFDLRFDGKPQMIPAVGETGFLIAGEDLDEGRSFSRMLSILKRGLLNAVEVDLTGNAPKLAGN